MNHAFPLVGGLLLLACTTTTTSSSPSSTSATNPAATTLDASACQQRCLSKAESCGGVPTSNENPGGTEGYCEEVCSSGLTEAQMTCLEGKACSALMSGSLASLCPASSSTSSSSSSSGSSSGTTPTTAKSVGDSCTCDKYGTDPGVYKTCTGNASACFDLDLSCLAEASTGKGQCVITCSASELGEKCPSGGTCTKSGKKAIDGGDWTICN